MALSANGPRVQGEFATRRRRASLRTTLEAIHGRRCRHPANRNPRVRHRAGVREAVVRVPTARICGADIHIVKGEYPVRPGLIVEAYDLFSNRREGVLRVAIRP